MSTSRREASDGRFEIEQIVLEADAIDRLIAYAQAERWGGALLVMDANTEEAAGAVVERQLQGAGVRVSAVRFSQRSGLLADEQAVEAVRTRLRAHSPDGLLAVGSGVLTDIVRYSASQAGRDFVSVPTAASMDGYTSTVAAMEFGGVKVSFPAVAPRAIFADPAVLAAAPPDLTRAGLGDLLGKASARTDWLAAHLLYGEAFLHEADTRILMPLIDAARHPEGVLDGRTASVKRLMHGLIESGLAMAMVGSSRPASGCEHHASHFWDLLAARGRRAHASHGLQVAYACRFAMRLQQYAFGGGVPELTAPSDAWPLDEPARAWLGDPSRAIEQAVTDKHRFAVEHAGSWPRDAAAWAAVRERLAQPLALFELVDQALASAGIPDEPGFLDIDQATLRAAFRYANRLRARYTVLDFLEGQGTLDQALDRVLPAGAAQEASVQ